MKGIYLDWALSVTGWQRGFLGSWVQRGFPGQEPTVAKFLFPEQREIGKDIFSHLFLCESSSILGKEMFQAQGYSYAAV